MVSKEKRSDITIESKYPTVDYYPDSRVDSIFPRPTYLGRSKETLFAG